MNLIRTNKLFRASCSLVLFVAWMVLSNHCALARCLANLGPQPEISCCAPAAPVEKQSTPCPEMPNGCCKVLKATLPDDAPTFAKIAPQFFIVPSPASAESELRALTFIPPNAPSNGPPPDCPGFVELVLNRSLLSHAPPRRA